MLTLLLSRGTSNASPGCERLLTRGKTVKQYDLTYLTLAKNKHRDNTPPISYVNY